MIIADTSIWIDHLRRHDGVVAALLEKGEILAHPFITGEVALDGLNQRASILAAMDGLPKAVTARIEEVRDLIERQSLFGQGLGYVDVHLLASALLTPEAKLWTRDRRLREAATRLQVAASQD